MLETQIRLTPSNPAYQIICIPGYSALFRHSNYVLNYCVYITPGDPAYLYLCVCIPGYSALFRHPNDVLNYCVYIIPGNPACRQEDLPYWHDKLIKDDPNISRALGSEFKMERMKAGGMLFCSCLFRGRGDFHLLFIVSMIFKLPFIS